MSLSPIVASRLEKAATDNGFDQGLEPEGDWLVFASTQCPLRVWLGVFGDVVFLAAFSQQNVARALGEYGMPIAAPMPKGAAGGRTVPDVPALHRLLRRAFQLSKALPNELLLTFEKQAAALPRTTEAERLVVQRVGQNLFRDGLLELWEGRCAVTELAVPSLLRASHIKPWADCETDAERLDVYNGILLAPHLDAAFDQGFITVTDDGAIVVSDALDAGAPRDPRARPAAARSRHRGWPPRLSAVAPGARLQPERDVSSHGFGQRERAPAVPSLPPHARRRRRICRHATSGPRIRRGPVRICESVPASRYSSPDSQCDSLSGSVRICESVPGRALQTGRKPLLDRDSGRRSLAYWFTRALEGAARHTRAASASRVETEAGTAYLNDVRWLSSLRFWTECNPTEEENHSSKWP
ncbi:MAG: HNH endonuclease [Polyangiaceae bacterium]|nr:HNH endonuclease [Polyangiaceae bacterium]